MKKAMLAIFVLFAMFGVVGDVSSSQNENMPVWVTDTIRTFDDLSNGIDCDPLDDRDIVVRWNYWGDGITYIDPTQVGDVHIYVRDGDEWIFLGRTGNNVPHLTWSSRQVAGSIIAADYKNGPEWGNSYEFRVYPMKKDWVKGQGFPHLGIFYNAGPVEYLSPSVPVNPIGLELRTPGMINSPVFIPYGETRRIEIHITHQFLTSPSLIVKKMHESDDESDDVWFFEINSVNDTVYHKAYVYEIYGGEDPGDHYFTIEVSDGMAIKKITIWYVVGREIPPIATPTPTTRPTPTPRPQLRASITNDEDSTENLVGKEDFDDSQAKKLVVKWNAENMSADAVISVGVTVDGMTYTLKRNIPIAEGMLSWFDGAKDLVSFQEGPLFDKSYKFIIEATQNGLLLKRVVVGSVMFLEDSRANWTPTPANTPTETATPADTPTSTPSPSPSPTKTSTPRAYVELTIGAENSISVTNRATVGVVDEEDLPIFELRYLPGSSPKIVANVTAFASSKTIVAVSIAYADGWKHPFSVGVDQSEMTGMQPRGGLLEKSSLIATLYAWFDEVLLVTKIKIVPVEITAANTPTPITPIPTPVNVIGEDVSLFKNVLAVNHINHYANIGSNTFTVVGDYNGWRSSTGKQVTADLLNGILRIDLSEVGFTSAQYRSELFEQGVSYIDHRFGIISGDGRTYLLGNNFGPKDIEIIYRQTSVLSLSGAGERSMAIREYLDPELDSERFVPLPNGAETFYHPPHL